MSRDSGLSNVKMELSVKAQPMETYTHIMKLLLPLVIYKLWHVYTCKTLTNSDYQWSFVCIPMQQGKSGVMLIEIRFDIRHANMSAHIIKMQPQDCKWSVVLCVSGSVTTVYKLVTDVALK